jgi:hypothetical protein
MTIQRLKCRFRESEPWQFRILAERATDREVVENARAAAFVNHRPAAARPVRVRLAGTVP